MTGRSDRRQWILLNPGPVNVSENVRRALLGPDLCHREEEFSRLMRSVRQKLLAIFGAQQSHSAAVMAGSGTLAVEAMLSSYGSIGAKVLVLSNGVYGERMAAMLQAHRSSHAVMRTVTGRFFSRRQIERALERDPKIRALAMVHHETSSGMLNPLDMVASVAKKSGRHLLVDAVSSLGAEKVDLSAIDFCAGSSGKCLHGFPGLAFVFVSMRGRRLLENASARSIYMDLGAILKAEDAGAPPFTPAVQLLYALDAALDELKTQGLERRMAAYAHKSAFIEAALRRANVRFLVEKKFRSHVLTAAWLPKGLTYERLHAQMKKRRFVIYAGQSALKGRIFRVSALGKVSESDLGRFAALFRRIAPKPDPPSAVVLAAGVGRRLGAHTRWLPKCLIPLAAGETLLSRYLDSFRDAGIRDIAIVVGHQAVKIRKACRRLGHGLKIQFIQNREYRKGSVLSLIKASSMLGRNVVIMDADVYFPSEALVRLLSHPKESAFLLDRSSRSGGEEMMLMAKKGRLHAIAKKIDPSLEIVGEATGIVKLSGADARALRHILKDFYRKKNLSVEYEDALGRLLKKRAIGFVDMDGLFWSEIDFEEDLKHVRDEATL